MSHSSKTFSFQVKDLGVRKDDAGQEFGQIEAYGAMFNNVDEGKDRILPGAFTRTIKNSKARAEARGKRYLVPMLWQHDDHEVIGGWYDVEQDSTGLRAKGDIALATQRGREYYALAKAGMTDEFSIIYDVPAGGAKFDKGGVRDLSELRLFSIDPVTFAMNDATYTVAVKASASGGASSIVGNAKGTIGPRDEAWDGAKAEGQIWAAAYDEDAGTVDKAVASKYFMVREGDGSKKGDYSYPFWYVGSSPHICVGAVKAIAGAIQGSRGADAPEGLKPRVEALYKRINAKYPDDPQLTPPWSEDSKARARGEHMNGKTLQRKTFEQHYQEEQCEDLLEDWNDVVLCALTSAVCDAIKIGDNPEGDVTDALDAFKVAVMAWVADAVKYELSDYLANQGYDGGAEYTMQNGGSRGYGYFSRRTPMHRKAMTASDATTGGFTADHVSKLKDAASKSDAAVRQHVKALNAMAESVKALVADAGNDSASGNASKAGRTFSAANSQALSDHADGLTSAADTLSKSMKEQTKAVSSVADDLATIIQGSEPAYGTDSGNAGEEQEGKKSGARSGRTSRDGARATRPSGASSHAADTLPEADIENALKSLKALRATPVPA